jgi:cation diffusion facilitator CzcD-associated flavoprotein CzcO
MAKAKRSGSAHKQYYQTYASRSKWASNRKAKLERALKRNPNNEQIKEALGNISYRRKNPKTKMWPHSRRAEAQLIKSFTGRADPSIWSSNREVASAALQTSRNPNKQLNVHSGGVSFLLAARAHDKYGRLVWG